MTLEQARYNAQQRGDTQEVARLDRLMARLDDQRQTHGRGQR